MSARGWPEAPRSKGNPGIRPSMALPAPGVDECATSDEEAEVTAWPKLAHVFARKCAISLVGGSARFVLQWRT